MNVRDKIAWCTVILLLCALVGQRLMRQDTSGTFPNRPVLLICPFSAGGGSDMLARGLARAAEADLGQNITVNNVTGGGGAVGFVAGLLAPPDGHTVTMITIELVSLPLQGLVPFQPDEFAPILRLNMDPAALAVRADCPANTFEEFIEWSKRGDVLSVGNSGPGTVWHMAAARLAEAASLELNHVPFGGASHAVTALVGGHIDAVTVSPGELRSQILAGQVKILGVMSDHRVSYSPDAPTFTELGYPLVFGTWRGLAVPRETPPEIRARLAEVFSKAAESAELAEFADAAGLNMAVASGSDFALQIENEKAEIGAIMKNLGLIYEK
ncbi:tripartite tricarboxylate transporter substrate binding protein [Coraliomargarita sp. W4R53]